MNRKIIAYSKTEYKPNEFKQLELFPLSSKGTKAQIESIPGISPKRRDRYRVVFGDRILAAYLTIDEALKLAKRGEK